jgi:GxxExxY protein
VPLEHEKLTEQIIGAAIEVHRRLGPGFIESIYHRALIVEITKRGLALQTELPIVIMYDGVEVGKHRLDLVIDATVIVELKSIKYIEDVHFAVVRSYLRASNLRHGLILNFSKTKLEVKRVIGH